MRRFRSSVLATAFTALACAGASEPAPGATCEQARSHLEGCFPGQAVSVPQGCTDAQAASILGSSCDVLEKSAGKADGVLSCFWVPWACTSSARATLEISVDECGQAPWDECPGVSSLSCAHVVVLSDGEVVREGYTNGNGRLTFDDLEEGTYEVQVLDREGRLASANQGDLVPAFGPATQEVALEDETWARFTLEAGASDAVRACSDVRARLTVLDGDDEPGDRRETEWSWLVQLERDGEALGTTRPMFIHHEATESGEDENVFSFRDVSPGDYTLVFTAVDVPSSSRRANPDYESLLRRYADEDVAPRTLALEITADDVPDDVTLDIELEDPRL